LTEPHSAEAAPEHQPPIGRRLARWLGIDLRSGEGLAAVLLFLCFFLFITFQYASKSVRQASFITALGAEKLPYVYLLVAFLSYPVLRLYSRYADRLSRHRLIATTCGGIGASMVLFWWLFEYSWPWVSVAFYVWLSIVSVMTVSQFWSLSNHVFDARQAKRLFGFVGAGGLLGSIAGGQVARIATGLVGTRYALLVAAVIILSAVALILWVCRLHPAREEPRRTTAGVAKLEKARGGLDIILRSRHLKLVSAVMILTVMVAQVVDVQFNWAVQQATTGLDQRTAFFGNFFTVMGISAFVFQLLFTARLHRVVGVGVSMRVLPVTMAVGTVGLFFAALAMPELLLAVALILKIGESGLRYSLDQSTRELLFLPVPAQARIKAKAFIDVFVQRGARGLAALLLLPVTFGLITVVEAGWITLGLIVVWLGVTVAAYREYVRSFRRGLRERTVDAELPIRLDDVATVELLVEALGSADARQVLHGLDLLAAHGRGRLVPPLLLYHDDPEVRRRTLEILREQGRREATPLIERRLGDDSPEVRAEAIRALAFFQGRDACELMLPRLGEAEASVRAAAVACLANNGGEEMAERAQEVLEEMLQDADSTTRAEAAKALGAITDHRFEGHLVRLLYDPDSQVVGQAIGAVRRRVAREGYNPLYVATLVSLLQRRRLKHEAREALVAFGEEVIPALLHFTNDPEEPLWVRRALPRTLARIGTAEAARALLDGLAGAGDAFLRRKLIEALGDMREVLDADDLRERVELAMQREAGAYLSAFGALAALGLDGKGRLEGARIVWDGEVREPTLLDQLLAERMEESLANMFGLLALVLEPRHVWAAHRSLTDGQPALRSHALEYLDNSVAGDLRRHLMAVVDDLPPEDRLRRANREYGVDPGDRLSTMRRLLVEGSPDDSEQSLRVATLYVIYSEGVEALFPGVEAVLAEEGNPLLVTETARWVTARLGLAVGPRQEMA
jgi:ATP:ADP antiporter, AAA family